MGLHFFGGSSLLPAKKYVFAPNFSPCCTRSCGITQGMPGMLRAVIVDDEELARGYIRELLRAHDEIEIAAECANGFEAVKAIAEISPDLVFLDVQMPKLDGFEVLELVDHGPAVIFVTAFDQYAMR